MGLSTLRTPCLGSFELALDVYVQHSESLGDLALIVGKRSALCTMHLLINTLLIASISLMCIYMTVSYIYMVILCVDATLLGVDATLMCVDATVLSVYLSRTLVEDWVL